MWIDFKLYFYVRIHKSNHRPFFRLFVVNWFQIVFLREDSQVKTIENGLHYSCELISNCIFTWGFTRRNEQRYYYCKLWIDFKLYFYVRIHKLDFAFHCLCCVVNWFQIVFLREDSQGISYLRKAITRCELISNCIFTWGFTRNHENKTKAISLWIDFKLYFYVRIHKTYLFLMI